MELTFNCLGPFSMARAAKAANRVVAGKNNDQRYSVSFWQRYLFDDDFPQEVAYLGGYWPGKLQPRLNEPLRPDKRDSGGYPL